MFASLFAFSLGLPLALGHFNLKYPATIGFDDEKQHDGPCGGFTPDFSKNNITDFHVNGDAIATLTTHKQGNWLYRITLDETASGNWTQIFPIVQQNGLGAFCEPAVSVPPRFVGQPGVLGIVSNTPDGILFQCASVRFVNGSIASPATCQNASSVRAQFSADSKLTSLLGGDEETTSTQTSGQPAATESSGAATTGTRKGSAFFSTTSGILLCLAALV